MRKVVLLGALLLLVVLPIVTSQARGRAIDIAVLDVQAEQADAQGETIDVTVTLENNGPRPASVSITLDEAPGGSSQTRSIAISNGATEELTFSWTATTIGHHTFTVTASLDNDPDLSNNVGTDSTYVYQSGIDARWVDDIQLAAMPVPGGHQLEADVSLAGLKGRSRRGLSDITISVRLTGPGMDTTMTAETNSSGVASFQSGVLDDGEYTLAVTDVQRTGITYVPEANVLTEKTILIQSPRPIANPQSVTTDKNTPVTITLTGSSPAGDSLTFSIETPPSNGSLGTINQLTPTSAEVVYTPNTGFSGADSFTFIVNDTRRDSEPAAVSINVVNHAPDANDDSATVDEGGTVTILDSNEASVLWNDTDPDGDSLTVTATPVTGPSNGTLTLNSDGTFSYTHDGSETASDSFVYEVCDDDASPLCSTATVSITVNPANDPPGAVDDSASVDEGGTVTTLDSGDDSLLANDTDPEDDALTVTTTTVSGPSNGSLTLNSNGTFSYTHDGSETTSDSFVYQACDDGTPQECSTATVSITVSPVNDPPIVVGESYSAVGNTLLQVADSQTEQPGVFVSGSLLDNDSDPDNDASDLTAQLDTATTGAAVTVNADGTFTYVPPPGITGADTFTYQVSDGSAFTTGTVTVNLTNMVWYIDNSATESGNGTSAAPFNTLAGFTAVQGDGTASDPEAGDTIFVYEGGGAYIGSISLLDNQQFLGEAAGLTIGDLSIPSGGIPRINSAETGHNISLASGTVVDSFTLGNSNADAGVYADAITGASIIDVSVDGSSSSAGTNGALIQGSSGNFQFTNFTAAGIADYQVRLANHGSGQITFTGTTSLAAGQIHAVSIDNVTAPVTFDQLNVDVSTGGVFSAANTSGKITVSGGSLTQTGGGDLIALSSVTGGADFSGTALSGDGGAAGVDIDGSSGTYTFGDLTQADLIHVTNSNGTFTFGNATVSTHGQGMNAVHLQDNGTSNITMGALTITTAASGDDGGFFASSSGNVSVTGASSVNAGDGFGVDVANTTLNNVVFSNVTATNPSGSGVRLQDAAGTVSFNNLDLTATGGTGFLVDSPASTTTVNVNSGGANSPSVSSTGAPAIDVSDTTVDMQFGSVTANNTSGSGVILQDNTGSTGLAGVDITNNGGTGLLASRAGTLTVTGTTNSIDTTISTALDVTNTRIGAAGATFQSVSATGVSANPGIVLNNTGSTAGLTVAGDGGTARNGSGGAIQDRTTNGISLTNTASVSLNYMTVQNNADNGIRGTGVAGLTMTYLTVDNNTDQVSPDEAGVYFTNLNGTSQISNTVVSNSHENNVILRNDSGTLSSLTVSNSEFRDADTTGAGASGFLMSTTGSASVTASFTGSIFSNNLANGLVADSANSSSLDVSVSSSTFQNNNVAVNMSVSGAANSTFDISNNATITGHRSTAINVFTNASSTGQVTGTIANNIVGTAGVVGSGSEFGSGVSVSNEGTTQLTLAITGNTIQEIGTGNVTGFEGIYVSDAVNSGDTAVTIANNTLDQIRDDRGINLQARVSSTVCTDINGNSVTNTFSDGIRVRQRDTSTLQVAGYSGGATSPTDMANHLANLNPAANSTAATVDTGFATPVPAGACRTVN